MFCLMLTSPIIYFAFTNYFVDPKIKSGYFTEKSMSSGSLSRFLVEEVLLCFWRLHWFEAPQKMVLDWRHTRSSLNSAPFWSQGWEGWNGFTLASDLPRTSFLNPACFRQPLMPQCLSFELLADLPGIILNPASHHQLPLLTWGKK